MNFWHSFSRFSPIPQSDTEIYYYLRNIALAKEIRKNFEHCMLYNVLYHVYYRLNKTKETVSPRSIRKLSPTSNWCTLTLYRKYQFPKSYSAVDMSEADTGMFLNSLSPDTTLSLHSDPSIYSRVLTSKCNLPSVHLYPTLPRSRPRETISIHDTIDIQYPN